MGNKAQDRSSLSMHEGIAVWCDCCSCEAEPYWQAVAAELGIEPGSDYDPDVVPDTPQAISRGFGQ